MKKYLAGSCTPQEKEAIESWYLSLCQKKLDKLNELDDTDYIANEDKIWNAISQQNDPKVKPLWPSIIVAASFFLFIGIGAYLINKQPHQQIQQIAKNQNHDLTPGRNKAILTLSNGKQIVLTNAKKWPCWPTRAISISVKPKMARCCMMPAAAKAILQKLSITVLLHQGR